VASFELAIAFVLPLEDTHPSGKVTVDSDGTTRFGLLSVWHADLVQEGFYTMPAEQAIILAKACYRAQYWEPIQGDSITSNVVAAQLLSIAVNDGLGTAVKMAQQTVGLSPDGIFGPQTLMAVNAMNPNQFLNSFGAEAKAHYRAIVAEYPAKVVDLQGWINRVNLISTFKG